MHYKQKYLEFLLSKNFVEFRIILDANQIGVAATYTRKKNKFYRI